MPYGVTHLALPSPCLRETHAVRVRWAGRTRSPPTLLRLQRLGGVIKCCSRWHIPPEGLHCARRSKRGDTDVGATARWDYPWRGALTERRRLSVVCQLLVLVPRMAALKAQSFLHQKDMMVSELPSFIDKANVTFASQKKRFPFRTDRLQMYGRAAKTSWLENGLTAAKVTPW